MTLQEAWDKRNKLCAEGNKLLAEGNKLHVEGNKLHNEEYKLYAEGDKLHTEGNKLHNEGYNLHAEGDLVFITSVINMYGPKVCIHWLSASSVQIMDENKQVLIKFE